MATRQNIEFGGLVTQSVTADSAGAYFVAGSLTLPSLTNGGGASGVVVTISQNSTTVYTGLAGANGFYFDKLSLAVGDVVHVALSSSATADQGKNTVRCSMQIGLGQ